MVELNEQSKNFINFVGKYGVATVIAIWLTYFMTDRVGNTLAEIRNYQHTHQLDTSYYLKTTEELRSQQVRTNLILQQICVNGSALRDRPNCFR